MKEKKSEIIPIFSTPIFIADYGRVDNELELIKKMSFKKLLKSLITPNPKWAGWIAYKNKKGKYVRHSILNGKRI